jgi:membrane protease YdiL (CAAX protease family)
MVVFRGLKGIVVYSTLVFYLFWLWVLYVQHLKNKNINYVKNSSQTRLLIIAFAGGVAMNLSVGVIQNIVLRPDWFWLEHTTSHFQIETDVQWAFYYPLAVFIGPILEELIFRGLLFNELLKKNVFGSSLIVSLVFTVSHDLNRYADYVGIFICSMFLNYLFTKEGLFSCIFFHSGFNVWLFWPKDNMLELINSNAYVAAVYFLIVILALVGFGSYWHAITKRQRTTRQGIW